mgnify:CR=1 FL=1
MVKNGRLDEVKLKFKKFLDDNNLDFQARIISKLDACSFETKCVIERLLQTEDIKIDIQFVQLEKSAAKKEVVSNAE